MLLVNTHLLGACLCIKLTVFIAASQRTCSWVWQNRTYSISLSLSLSLSNYCSNYCCPTYSGLARIHKLSLEEIPITLYNISNKCYTELHQLIYFCLDTSHIDDIDDTLGNLIMTLFFHLILTINFSDNISNTISTFDYFHF